MTAAQMYSFTVEETARVLRDGSEVSGIPSSVDTHVTAHEVFLRPSGDDDTEIGVSFAAIASAE